MIKEKLINFENTIVNLFEQGQLPYPIHFSGGNEDQLIEIFKKIEKKDWVFSTHRSHYHYLLKGGSEEKLLKMILAGNSLHVFDSTINFFSSAIVAGCCTIAAGVACGLKKKNSMAKVFCFVGDGAEEEGSFYEAVRYVDSNLLPCTFIIEDNNLSVDTPKNKRQPFGSRITWPPCVIRYTYSRQYPHVQTGKFIKAYEL